MVSKTSLKTLLHNFLNRLFLERSYFLRKSLMSVVIEKIGFASREEAIKLAKSEGFFFRDGAMETGDIEDIHWHKTGLHIYVLSGLFETFDAARDEVLIARGGDLIKIPKNTLHAARCPIPATYLVGFESENAAKGFQPELPEDLP